MTKIHIYNAFSTLPNSKITTIIMIKLIIMSALLTSGCTTDADIKRQQMLEGMATQMVQNQKMTAVQTVRLQNIEEKMGMLRGNIEDAGHTRQQIVEKRIKELSAALSTLQEEHAKTQNKVALIETNSINQKKYLDKVLGALTQINSKMGVTRSKKKKGKKQNPFQRALSNYRRGKYAKAKPQFLDLLKDKKIKGNLRARIIHNIGMSEYMLGNCDKSIVYYSKLITQFPKAPFNSNGLLFLGKCFEKLNKKEEAKQSYSELIKRYPKAKQVKEARKLLKKL